MIVEHAILHVKQGESAEFEAAMRAARELIAASPGFHSIEVRRGAEVVGTYLLRVEWSDIAAHRDGFRQSDRYARWRDLLHHFYDSPPSVGYFSESIV